MNSTNTLLIEQGIVGSLLKDPDLFIVLRGQFTFPENRLEKLFQDPLCKAIIIEYNAWFEKRSVSDRLLLMEKLDKLNIHNYEGIKSIEVLLLQAVESFKIVLYIEVLQNRRIKLELEGISTWLAVKLEEDMTNPLSLLNELELSLNKLKETAKPSLMVPFSTSMQGFMDSLNSRKASGSFKNNVLTGFTELDKMMRGFKNGELIVLGARPAMGKSSFLISLSRNMVVQCKKKVAYFTLEQSTEQVMERFVSVSTQISLNSFQSGSLTEDEALKLVDADLIKKDLPFFIADISSCLLVDLIENTRIAVRKNGVEIIMIDYLQLIRVHSHRGSNRESEIAFTMRSLKELARELDIPIIVSSQLSRAVETRGGDKKPQLSDLRESGSIEQDADKVLFLHRAEYYGITEDENGFLTEGVAELIIAKNRTGVTTTIRLEFEGRIGLFRDMYTDKKPFKDLRKDEFDHPF